MHLVLKGKAEILAHRDQEDFKAQLVHLENLARGAEMEQMEPEEFLENREPRATEDLMAFLVYLVKKDTEASKVPSAFQALQERTDRGVRMVRLDREECREKVVQEVCWAPEDLLVLLDSVD